MSATEQEPAANIKAEALANQYRERFSENKDYRQSLWKLLVSRFFQQFIDPDSSVLDLGCGWGEFINNVRANKKYAIDLNPDVGEKLDREVELHACDCTRPWPVAQESLDVVFTSNFLEHLFTKRDVEDALAMARAALKPGGKIICMGPNVKFVPGAYWDFWDHYVAITEHSLTEALQLAGFEIEICYDRFLPYTMSGGFTPPLIFVRVFLKIPLLWRIFGKQFLLVAKKK